MAGTQLSRTGDLADAHARLQRAGVTRALLEVGAPEREQPPPAAAAPKRQPAAR